jgi:hypothetical protein
MVVLLQKDIAVAGQELEGYPSPVVDRVKGSTAMAWLATERASASRPAIRYLRWSSASARRPRSVERVCYGFIEAMYSSNILVTPSALARTTLARVLNLAALGLRLAMAPALRSWPR